MGDATPPLSAWALRSRLRWRHLAGAKRCTHIEANRLASAEDTVRLADEAVKDFLRLWPGAVTSPRLMGPGSWWATIAGAVRLASTRQAEPRMTRGHSSSTRRGRGCSGASRLPRSSPTLARPISLWGNATVDSVGRR
jgi:hypothetical protein